MHCNPDFPADVIPVDTAMNAIIAAAWERGMNETKKIQYCNITLPHEKQMTWGESVEKGIVINQIDDDDENWIENTFGFARECIHPVVIVWCSFGNLIQLICSKLSNKLISQSCMVHFPNRILSQNLFFYFFELLKSDNWV